MEQNKDYKKLYMDLKKQFDRYLKHKRVHAKHCKYCKEFYKEVLEDTNKIKNKDLRKSLSSLWNVLWLNGSSDFDIILYELDWDKLIGGRKQ